IFKYFLALWIIYDLNFDKYIPYCWAPWWPLPSKDLLIIIIIIIIRAFKFSSFFFYDLFY
ncbi:MAG: hypothetical protein N7Q72_06255, partial [Spiroplasma sp. Tabriz.8]|nr:hypothetical protein [Spiroplasma sp. Tabriz.8]